jgi:hypothetical protein
MDVLVRSMDQLLWWRLKSAAALQGKPINALLTEIIRKWLDRHYPTQQG